MEYRQLGGSGFKMPALTLGTGTFGGGNEFFNAWGGSGVDEATRLVDICLDASFGCFSDQAQQRLLSVCATRNNSGRTSVQSVGV
jgi:hypothetical protein